MRRGTAKDALAQVRWKDGAPDWSGIDVVIRHHGAPGDRKTVAGRRITGLGRSFFEVDAETQIPYHRILKVVRGPTVLYERGASPAGSSSAKRS
jgi:uncharacterized protein (UPF0248 family)